LSMFVRTSRGRLPLAEANHSLASYDMSKHIPSILATSEKSRSAFATSEASKPMTASLLERRDSQADASHETVLLHRPALHPRSSLHASTGDSRNSPFIDLTSEPSNGRSDSSKTG